MWWHFCIVMNIISLIPKRKIRQNLSSPNREMVRQGQSIWSGWDSIQSSETCRNRFKNKPESMLCFRVLCCKNGMVKDKKAEAAQCTTFPFILIKHVLILIKFPVLRGRDYGMYAGNHILLARAPLLAAETLKYRADNRRLH